MTDECTCTLSERGNIDWAGCDVAWKLRVDPDRPDHTLLVDHVVAATRRLDAAERAKAGVPSYESLCDDFPVVGTHDLGRYLYDALLPFTKDIEQIKAEAREEASEGWRRQLDDLIPRLRDDARAELRAEQAAAQPRSAPTDEEIEAGYMQWRDRSTFGGVMAWRAAVAWLLQRGAPPVTLERPSYEDEWEKWLAEEAGHITDAEEAFRYCWDLHHPQPPEPVDPFEEFWKTVDGQILTNKEMGRLVWNAALTGAACAAAKK